MTAPSRSGSPSVTAVIPTTGRPELVHAVASVRRQVYQSDIEVVVVVDRPGVLDISEIGRLADRVIQSQASGAAQARNLGAQSATTDLIAFLDDDDLWDAHKTARQVEQLVSAKVDLVSCRVRMMRGEELRVRGVPRTLLSRTDTVDSYLFRHRRPGSRRASLYTSTIVARRAVIESVPWRQGLQRHQDWDWLIRCQNAGFVLTQSPDELVTISMGSPGSISAASDWEASLNWAVTAIHDPHVLSDFLTAQTLRYAMQARSAEGVRRVCSELARLRVVPGPGPVAIGLAGAAPRTELERMMKWIR